MIVALAVIAVAAVVALPFTILWGLDCRRQRDGAREVARQAKQGWDAAAARADLTEKARGAWQHAAEAAWKEVERLRDKGHSAPRPIKDHPVPRS